MRTALVTTAYPSRDDDAAGHFVRSEALALDGEVHVICPRAERDRDDGIRLWPIDGGDAFGSPGVIARLRARPSRVTSLARFVWGARRALATIAPDRVIAHWLLPCAWPIALGHPALEVVVHGSDARLFARLPAMLRRHIATSLDEATVRVVSETLLDDLAPIRGEVAPCPIDIPHDLEPLSSGGRPFALVVGRLVAGKRIHLAIDAAARASIPLVVIGDGPLRRALDDGRATLLGQLPRRETLRYIAAASLLLHPSRDEGAPTVVREARALGTPVISLGAGAVRGWAAEDDGIEVVDDLAAALQRRAVRA